LLMVFLIFIVQGGDLLQHAGSVAFGRRPIARAISASRTWEGFVCGVFGAGIIGVAFFWLTPFGLIPAALMGMAAAACGGTGRMVMAAIKRDRGVTDWGHMNDGQGGLLDRMDSLIFASPVFFHLTRFFWGA
jgi:phosphatidate cytidylyltransferase